MKLEKIYPKLLLIFLISSVVVSIIGLITNAFGIIVGKCIINIGIIILYLTPIAFIMTLLIDSVISKKFYITILTLILLIIILVNVYYLGLPRIC